MPEIWDWIVKQTAGLEVIGNLKAARGRMELGMTILLIFLTFVYFALFVKLDALAEELRYIRKELEKINAEEINAEEWDFRE